MTAMTLPEARRRVRAVRGWERAKLELISGTAHVYGSPVRSDARVYQHQELGSEPDMVVRVVNFPSESSALKAVVAAVEAERKETK
jgi:hypothetical protein